MVERIGNSHLESMAARLAEYCGPVSIDSWESHRAFCDNAGRTIVVGSTNREVFDLAAAWLAGAYYTRTRERAERKGVSV